MKQKKKKTTSKIETRKRIKRLRKQLPEPQKCSISGCPNLLFETFVSADTEPYMIDGKPVCKEHYFKELGEEIEKHPIGVVPKRIKTF